MAEETTRQDRILYRNRRRMAWASFVFLSITGLFLLWKGMQSKEAAEIVGAMMPLITALFTAWGTVILAYVASKAVTDWKTLGTPD